LKYFNKIYIGFFVKTKLNFRWQIGIDDLDILERQKNKSSVNGKAERRLAIGQTILAD